jgi:hypothetical protein
MTALAIPYHAGVHPYEPVAIQGSCHTPDALGETPQHAEWTNVEDAFPNLEFAESLVWHLWHEGTFLM